MELRFNGLTDTGVLRTVNQDDYYIDPEGRFFIVADGMGGHAGGQEASKIATMQIRAYLEEQWESSSPANVLLQQALIQANQSIIEDQRTNPEREEMGTTVVVMLFRQGEAWCAHVGDSRLYRWRDSQLEQITEDHTWVGRALKLGELTAEQAKKHPYRHILSQCLGREDIYQIAIQQLDERAGDRWLLCSDGLTEEVSDEYLSSYLQSHDNCEELVSKLVEAAKQAGGSDNITVIVVAQDEWTKINRSWDVL